MILFYLPALSPTLTACLMFFLGILCCYQALVFTIVGNQVPPSSASLAIAITNCINMSFGHFFHTMIASTLKNSWNGQLSDSGTELYSMDNLIYSLAIIPICCFIGQLGFVFLAMRKGGAKTNSL